MIISQKQASLLEAIKSRRYDIIYLIGAIGTSKTYGMAYAFVNIAWQFPGSFIPIGRKSLSEIRVGTWHSFVEVMDTMGLTEGQDYTFVQGNDLRITFSNRSVIQFIQMDKTKDREWQKIKSINATATGVDEVDGVDHGGFVMLASRTGRKNTNGAPDVTVATCNPNETWVKELVYKPWRAGTLPDNVLVIEFEMQDSFLYSSGFYDKYEGNPPQWKQRYLMNNWDYLDDESSLFKSRLLDSIHRMDYDKEAKRYLGVDVAREGKDRSVFAQIVGDTLIDIQVIARSDLERLALDSEKIAPPYTTILGREVLKYATREEIGYSNSAVDAVGNGGGVVDYLRSQLFRVNEFKAGGKANGNYDMLRSEMYMGLAQDMEKGKFFLYEGCPFLSELKQELLYHQYEIKDKVMAVESKDKIKLRLGKSPDIADAVIMAYYNKKRIPDSRYNKNRIG